MSREEAPGRARRLWAAVAAGLLLAALAAASLAFVVEEGQMALVVTLGRTGGRVHGPGLHWKAPWPFAELVRLDGRLRQSLAEHRAIVQALTARQPEQAAERMSAHFTNGLQAAQ